MYLLSYYIDQCRKNSPDNNMKQKKIIQIYETAKNNLLLFQILFPG